MNTYYYNVSGRIEAKNKEEVLGFLKMSLGFRSEINLEDIKIEEEK